ncbi:uncharacterized protein PADG_07776 [Paracoccidioides brasiliensis Pb18]|uniref:Uncharacterized protein n=1 Tax=Paracoccidioides brasiliensis (strain Pb18) TaxID=502780 RepID=C1GKJ0_PARBD|nr:uncharacterized protein PADG_07776 [Paracoccidioides brasiliensis Pb18]EEH42956.2 hypothetical protein PADG_07776 [Paracoccidioides brasiliensis Pb18]
MPGSAHKPSNNHIPPQNPTAQYNPKILSVRKSPVARSLSTPMSTMRRLSSCIYQTIQAKYHQVDDVASSIGEQFGMLCDHIENGRRGNTLRGLLRRFKRYPAFVRDMGGVPVTDREDAKTEKLDSG